MSQTDDPYLNPGTTVLRNKLNIRDAGRLGRAEDDLAGAHYAALLSKFITWAIEGRRPTR